VPLPVPGFRSSMTYHDVGYDKLAAKTVDLTIDMAASAGVAVSNGGRKPASWSHSTYFGSQRETKILDEALARPDGLGRPSYARNNLFRGNLAGAGDTVSRRTRSTPGR